MGGEPLKFSLAPRDKAKRRAAPRIVMRQGGTDTARGAGNDDALGQNVVAQTVGTGARRALFAGFLGAFLAREPDHAVKDFDGFRRRAIGQELAVNDQRRRALNIVIDR